MRKFTLLKFNLLFAVILILTSSAFSQNRVKYNLFTVNDNNSFSSDTELQKAVNNALVFNINKAELNSLFENRNPEINIEIPDFQNGVNRLNLNRFDILKSNVKIVARTINGNEEVKPEDLAVSYTGKIEGMNNSLVSITFSKDNVTGIMVTENDHFVIGALNEIGNNNSDRYILYKERDLKINKSFFCRTEDNLSSSYIEKMRNIIIQKMNVASATDLYVAEVAIEIDFATFNVYGASVTNATNYAIALMSATSALYMMDLNVKLIIPYIRVWTTPDPYTGTDSYVLLSQFTSEWNATQQSVQRTLAHFITRRAGNLGGIAWLDVLCSNLGGGYGYGFSNTDGGISSIPRYSWDVEVVAHEIGHNFGSNHTHNCGWVGGPIDSCYQVEGGCYSGPPIPRNGTIMSYCDLTSGGISLSKGFGPQPRTLMRNSAETAPCMYVAQRELYVGYPNGGKTFRTGFNAQIYWGTSLTGNVNIELSLNNGSTWQTIQNNVSAANRAYSWVIPYISSTPQAKIRIINSSNPAIGDTCDNAFRIILNLNSFSPVSPPSFTRVSVSPNDAQIQKFSWTSAGSNPTISYKFKIKKIATSLEYSFISDNNGSDTVLSLRKSQLDSLASVLGTTGDSVRCTWRVLSFNGVDSLSTSTSNLVTLVRTSVGINLISTAVPDKFSLGNNYPNPFNPETIIKFDIAKNTNAKLILYDSKGSEISTLVNEKLSPGNYEYKFTANNLPSGVYFYRLITSDFNETKRMILLK